MTKNKLVELVNLWDAYEQDHPNTEIADFCRDYLAQLEVKAQQSEAKKTWGDAFPLEGELTGVLARLGRFSNIYGKKVLSQFDLNVEDFVYLLGAWEMGEVKKKDLIQAQLSEFTSGIGVINRLLKHELLEEKPDPEDRRSKLVKITEAGQGKLYQLMPEMDKIAKIIFTGLSQEEKQYLYHLLSRLEKLHEAHYPEVKKKNPEEIAELFEKNGR